MLFRTFSTPISTDGYYLSLCIFAQANKQAPSSVFGCSFVPLRERIITLLCPVLINTQRVALPVFILFRYIVIDLCI